MRWELIKPTYNQNKIVNPKRKGMSPYNDNRQQMYQEGMALHVSEHREDVSLGTDAPMRVLMNHIYEYQKGVRRMVLYTFNKKYMKFAIERLERQGIDYVISPLMGDNVNLFFGRKECLEAIRLMVVRPLNQLSPEEDFILGALLGYDICMQCERFCERKQRTA